MDFNKQIDELALQNEVTYVGVADLAPVHDAILEQGDEVMAGYPYAISLGIVMPNDIVDQLPNRSSRLVALNYMQHSYHIINQRLDVVASLIGSFLQRNGYGVTPIPAAEQYDRERECAAFSHKLGAHLSGLGWIGKSCLLITPEHGPRVRWTSVLTDAPLQPTGQPMQQKCGNCAECVDACPAQAFTGRAFSENEPREARYDAYKCRNYHKSIRQEYEFAACGMCIYICPWGRKKQAALHVEYCCLHGPV